MKISIEYIKQLEEEIAKINRLNIEDIQFFENGIALTISQATIDEFRFTGLNNINFITLDIYKGLKGEEI